MPELRVETSQLISTEGNRFGIDRRRLMEIRDQFIAVNKQRLALTRLSLQDRQNLVLDLIPLLFHINHPMLPGFINRQVPCGVCGFKPSKETLRDAKRLSRGFRYQPLDARHQSIEALFVMGSVGTIGQSPRSDLDIWVCHQSDLGPGGRAALAQKCEKISQWAHEINLDVCFFPMDSRRFRQGETLPLSEESSGNAQHGLLLDEFYRSAIHLGGKVPLWWFVPTEQESHYQDYVHELLYRRFVREQEVIDFGQPTIPAKEYITAAIWQLYKGIHSPHKSVLKLMLLEAYAASFPNTRLLSSEFKHRVHQGKQSARELDPYLLTAETIENYLRKPADRDKLELVRRCLYFKVGKALSQRPKTSPPSWQRVELQALVNRWGWSHNQLLHLDARRQWKARAVAKERHQLVRTLLLGYRQLSEFIQASRSPLMQKEISLLGRKLHAAFERRAGKIDFINPDISPDISEPYLSVIQKQADGDQWLLIEAQPSHRDEQRWLSRKPLKSAYSPAELLVWAYCNGVWSDQTQVWLQPAGRVAAAQARLYSALNQWLPLPINDATHNSFTERPSPRALLLVINLLGHALTSGPTQAVELDPLNMGRDTESLINDGHIAVHNSWNEVQVHSFTQNSLESLLTEYLKHITSAKNGGSPTITILCSGSEHARQLQQRVEQLVQHLTMAFRQPNSNSRFILFHSGIYSSWQVRQGQVQWQRLGDDEQLFRYLQQPQPVLSRVCLDRFALRGHPLQAMVSLPTRPAIQVGFRREADQADVLVLDEKGSLFQYRSSFHSEASLLRPLHQFLRNVVSRLSLEQDESGFVGVYPIEFYALKKQDGDKHYTAERLGVTRDIEDLPFFDIQVIVEVDSFDHIHYAIYSGDLEFHEAEYGQELFNAVATHILNLRHDQRRYPCYITDLDLSACSHIVSGDDPLQTSHYLRIKADIEHCLNLALREI